jgi:tetratricopeptide (TPR) repeat protein
MIYRYCIVLILLIFFIIPVLSDQVHSSPWIEQGRSALQGGQYTESITLFNKAIQEGTDLNTAYNNRGVAELRLGMCNESILSFNSALQLNNSNPNSYHNLALAQKCSGDRTGAYDSIEKGLNRSPTHPGLLMTRGIMECEDGAYQKGLDSLNQSIVNDPNNAAAYYEKSNVLFMLNDFSGAYDAILEASNISPDDLTYLFNRGVTEERLQLYRNALETYDQVLTRDPSHIKALSNKASIYWIHNRFNESLEAFTKVTEIDPSRSEAWYFRGLSEKSLGLINESSESFRMAATLEPGNREYRAYADHYESLPSKQQRRPIPFSPFLPVIALLSVTGISMIRRMIAK